MARYRLSGPAQLDLAAVLSTSLERWGVVGRERYARLLTAAMRFVADDPRGPTTQDRAELLPGIRSFHIKHVRGKHGVKAPVHVLYFRCADVGTIEVVRVLHERIEPSRHVCEPEVQRRPKRRRRRKLR